ncbi:MAG: glutamate 5-kinase [Pseudomonadota bacterium]
MAALSDASRVVVKIGSSLLVGSEGLKRDWLASLCADIAWLKRAGKDVVVVSSGSIALGRRSLGLPDNVLALEQSQAAAAVGQIRLARAYEEALAPHGITTAQVLVTLEDSEDRRRYLNTRATLAQLLSFCVVPIVNENDTVATDEIRYGDNDRLAAQVAVTVGADQLVLLSDVDGFYTGHPSEPSSVRLESVARITPEIEAMAGDAGSGLSKGGMKTKVMAAKMAVGAGCAMAITLGSRGNPLKSIEEGAPATWFLPKDDPALARKRWISSMKPRGALWLDAGAVRALEQGKSLLPAGVTSVTGAFGRGDAVSIVGPEGSVFGVGLTRYTAEEANAIKGRHTADFAAILGYAGRAALIHRDDMVL